MHLVPKEKHDKLKYDLALNLRAIVAQQLIPTADGEGRCSYRNLLNSPMVAELSNVVILALSKKPWRNRKKWACKPLTKRYLSFINSVELITPMRPSCRLTKRLALDDQIAK